MGIVQDTQCGIRKFTLRDCFMDWDAVQNIFLWVPDWDGMVPISAILKPKPLWTGKQILSLTIPKGINIYRSPDPKSSNPVFDNGVLIENGELIFGIVEKKTVGASQGGLVHVVFREKGLETTRRLFTGLQMVVNYWLFHNGFNIDIGDTIADSKTMAYIAERKANVSQIIEDATHDRLKAVPGMTIRESFESLVERQLNLARDTSSQYAQKHLKKTITSSRWRLLDQRVHSSTFRRCLSVSVNSPWRVVAFHLVSIIAPYLTSRKMTSAQNHGISSRTLPPWPYTSGNFLPRHGWSRGSHRYRRQNRRDRLHSTSFGHQLIFFVALYILEFLPFTCFEQIKSSYHTCCLLYLLWFS